MHVHMPWPRDIIDVASTAATHEVEADGGTRAAIVAVVLAWLALWLIIYQWMPLLDL